MTPKVFTKLLGLFFLLLLFHALVVDLLFHRLSGPAASDTLHLFIRESFGAALLAFLIALPSAGWVASRISSRLGRVADFARSLAQGNLSARLDTSRRDEFSSMDVALNEVAERLGKDLAEIDSSRLELTTMLDSMQEAVVAVTAAGYVRWSNAVMQRIAGAQLAPGRPLVHFVRDPELLACLRTALEKGEVAVGRASVLAPGRIFEINVAPLPSGGALAVLHDVTSIEAAQKSRREFVANVSHELRTPLTSIQGYVETLIEDPHPHPDTLRDFLGVILKNATRMNRLTEDLLALASVESPDYKLKPQPVKASTLLQDAIDSIGGIVVDSGVRLESSGAPDALVMADADAMNQVFGNLMENSLKYAKSGKKLLAGARLLDAEVEFTIRDFGPGIASEHIERIFERFYRVDKARSRESGGTGLGLAIVKHIVQAHGGRIWCVSELGHGAEFHFTLPLAPPQNAAPAPQAPATQAATSTETTATSS